MLAQTRLDELLQGPSGRVFTAAPRTLLAKLLVPAWVIDRIVHECDPTRLRPRVWMIEPMGTWLADQGRWMMPAIGGLASRPRVEIRRMVRERPEPPVISPLWDRVKHLDRPRAREAQGFNDLLLGEPPHIACFSDAMMVTEDTADVLESMRKLEETGARIAFVAASQPTSWILPATLAHAGFQAHTREIDGLAFALIDSIPEKPWDHSFLLREISEIQAMSMGFPGYLSEDQTHGAAIDGVAPLIITSRTLLRADGVVINERGNPAAGWPALPARPRAEDVIARANWLADVHHKILEHAAEVPVEAPVQGDFTADGLHAMAADPDPRSLASSLAKRTAPDSRDDQGRTPLMIAAGRGHDEHVRLLLRAGAHLNTRDALGRSAIAYAAMGGHLETLIGLMQAGADLPSCGAPDAALQRVILKAAEII
jgi:hypothetical protein